MLNDRWLDETDGNGYKLGLWCCKGKSDTTAYCFVCDNSVWECRICPSSSTFRRSKTRIHLAKIACSDSQTKIAFKTIQNASSLESQGTSEVSETIPVPVCNICVTSKKDGTCTSNAEIIWAAKTGNDNYSFRSSDGIGDTFRAMLSNPETRETFSMSRTKLS